MGLEALSPEEKATLKAALDAEMGGGGMGCDCDAKFEAVANVLDQIVAGLDALRTDVDAVKKTVFDDMIGGIKKLYGDNQRAEGISGLKEKYGSLFDPHMEAFGEMYPGTDLYDSLYGEMEKLRGGEGYTDEMGDSRMKAIADALRGKVEKIRGPAAAKVEVAAAPAEAGPAGEEDPMASIVDRVKSLKKGKNRNMDFMPGANG